MSSRLAAAAAASLAILAITTVLVATRVTDAFDLATTRTLQSIASFPLDLLANANTLFGQATTTTVLAGLLALVAWRREGSLAWLALGGFGIVAVAGIVLKLVLVHPEPPAQYARSLWDPLGVAVTTASSFPSGHVARVSFLALVAAELARRRSAWLLAGAFVAYTVWARVYIGDHWISDAIGGVALGAALACPAAIWIETRRAYARSA